MTKRFEKQVAMCRCSVGKKAFGVTMKKTDSGWSYYWAFKLGESTAKSEGFDATDIVGNIYMDPEYPGCPYCGGNYFIICSCGKLNCNNTSGKTFTCQWCGTTADEFYDYDGSGIKAAGDI